MLYLNKKFCTTKSEIIILMKGVYVSYFCYLASCLASCFVTCELWQVFRNALLNTSNLQLIKHHVGPHVYWSLLNLTHMKSKFYGYTSVYVLGIVNLSHNQFILWYIHACTRWHQYFIGIRERTCDVLLSHIPFIQWYMKISDLDLKFLNNRQLN